VKQREIYHLFDRVFKCLMGLSDRAVITFIRKSGLIPRRTAGPRLLRLKYRNAYKYLVLNQMV
jgi:hypothetical protein